MKITRNYYDLAQKELEEILARHQEEKARKTPEEIARDERKAKQEIESCIKCAREREEKRSLEQDEGKKAQFKKFCKYALLLAGILDLNLEIDTDNKAYSTIEFTTGQMFFVEDTVKEIRKMFAGMFLHADEMWIDRQKELVRVLFFFRMSV